MTDSAPSVALLSAEPWDDHWRRNQHLAAQLVRQGLVSRLLFVEPATSAPRHAHCPEAGITVVTPRRRLPNRLGGTRVLGARLQLTVLEDIDVLWVNDPVLGAAALRRRQPAVYDVTDDWRTAPTAPRLTRRTIRSENRLARRALTVVCSTELQRRWRERYDVEAAVVHNAVDEGVWPVATPRPLAGPGPHVGYVGTLHEERLDLDLLEALARDDRIGTVHLVGPDVMNEASRQRLHNCDGIVLHGAIHAEEVPSWTTSFDVLISPHRITEFTLSLDAIKSYEYLASGRPIVATPTSGFQHLAGPTLRVVTAEAFANAVHEAASAPSSCSCPSVPSWAERARQFAEVIVSARQRG